MLSGIFAISIYDRSKKIIYLIRDVLGVKPFYYYLNKIKKVLFFFINKTLLLSSEKKELNMDAINSYSNFKK